MGINVSIVTTPLPQEILEIAEKIKSMEIRGATKIGRAAATALKIAAEKYNQSIHGDYMDYIERVAEVLIETRPTAVTLPNSIRYVLGRIRKMGIASPKALVKATVKLSNEFIDLTYKAQNMISVFGERLIEDGATIMTHCNSSTAISILLRAVKNGKKINVYVTETRPKFQGHITARTLSKAGINVTLIVDSAARYFMKDVDVVLVGADSIAANGAVVNKIGTSQIALVANESRVPFYVAAETYKFSPNTMLGELVPIEERDPYEIVSPEFLEENPNISVRNPAFDVTPPKYITAIITEKGVIPPQGVALILMEEYGWSLGEEYEEIITEE